MKSNTELRQKSIRKVLNEIRSSGPVSKRELQDITGFSWGNISSITTELLNGNYISVSGKQETYVGRKPEMFDINEHDNFIIGIDFSTKGVLAVLCDLKGRVLLKLEEQFQIREKQEALNTLYSLIEHILKSAKGKKVLQIAIAMQGDVDQENGVSLRIRKIEGWRNVPVCSLLKEKFGINAVMLHDPDCILHTEKYYGILSGQVVNNAILLSITNHGVGIAALLGGKIYMGNGGKTCEIGNMVIPSGSDNKPDLLQNIFTVNWIGEQYSKESNVTLLGIAEKARMGDSKAKAVFSNLGNSLGVALNNASNLFNPEKVILFGSYCKFADLFLESTNLKLYELMGEEMPTVVLSEFDDTAAAIGATLFAADLVVKQFNF